MPTENEGTPDEETPVEEPTDEPAAEVEPGQDGDAPAAEPEGDPDAAEDAIDLDELATLVADKLRGGGDGEPRNGGAVAQDEDELMAKVRRVIREEKDSDRAEDRIADKVAAKVGGRSPDPPPAPEYRRLAKLLFGKRG